MKRKIRPLEVVMLAAPVILLAVFWWPQSSERAVPRTSEGFWDRVWNDSSMKRASCQSNLKQIGMAFFQYAQDYDAGDGAFPHTTVNANGSYGWADALLPYVRNPKLFQCPGEGYEFSGNPRARDYTDYWMNANLAGISWEKIDEPAWTILAGDGNDGNDQTDARYSRKQLPSSWLRERRTPATRHPFRGPEPDTIADFRGANYLFADGHVSMLRPEDAKSIRAGSAYGFSLQKTQKSRR
jgi:prepilin-type processing-associated H-X9-DG protein